GRTLLSDGAVDTNQIVALVVDDGVQNHSSLAGLAVTNDEFALPTANGNHGINGLDACRHRLTHGLTINNAGSTTYNVNQFFASQRTLVVNGVAQGIQDAAYQCRTRRHRHDVPGAPDFVAFLHFRVVTKQHRAHLVFFQIHGDAGNIMAEVEQLAGHDFVQAVEAGNPAPQRDASPQLVPRN